MNKKKWSVGILAISVFAFLALVLEYKNSSDWFVEYPLPLKETHRFFDIGVVDANNDGLLDIYTSNHHFRQALLIAEGQGGYRDVLSEWGLDQSREFPMAELSFIAPAVDKPGLYIYWLGTQLVIRTHKIGEDKQWQGSLQVNDPIEIIKNEGFIIRQEHELWTAPESMTVSDPVTVSDTSIEFSTNTDAKMVMRPGGQGLPIRFQLSDAVPVNQVYVGRGMVTPQSRNFTLAMQDRHAMAWADYNNDGLLDIFIPRGALGGDLRVYPQNVVSWVKDELLVSQEEGRFADIASDVGIRKKDCSGRHASWLDFNRDGLLDLFVNCHDRNAVKGDFPKQLYRQDALGNFHDVAMETRMGTADQQFGSFAWIDVDNDGDVDLVTLQDDGVFLYRNQGGRFSQESVHRTSLAGAERIGRTTGRNWLYDGKLTVSDYDADGDLDLFSASKRGNLLLTNENGQFTSVNLISVGLPAKSVVANWVDYDNDGRPDLHVVPQGIFRQRKDRSFESTALLSFPSDQYQAAICNWFDIDNDGRLDVLMALKENPSFKHWWDFSREPRRRSTWPVKTYRNTGAENHWLQIELVGANGNRQAIGARVTVVTPDGKQAQEVGSTDGAFFSQGHYRLYYGLRTHKKADAIKIRWSDGYEQELLDITGDKLIHVERDGSKAIE